MQVRWLKIGDFGREALSDLNVRHKFVTLSVHLICLQHVRMQRVARVCQRQLILVFFSQRARSLYAIACPSVCRR